jgi:hypothetical protein
MKKLHAWKSTTRKGLHPPTSSHRVPQPHGIPGWILLTHDQESQPVALFEDGRGKVESLTLILDDRMCCDTVLRAIRLSASIYVVCDLLVLNGINLYERRSYTQRRETLDTLVDEFHSPDLVALVRPEELPHGTLLRGHEYYDDAPGTMGIFLPAVE